MVLKSFWILLIVLTGTVSAAPYAHIKIQQPDGTIVERVVYDPQHYFESQYFHCQRDKVILSEGTASSPAMYAYVVALQERFPELPQCPLILVTIPAPLWKKIVYLEPSGMTEIVYQNFGAYQIIVLPIDTIDQTNRKARFFLGHELGHVAYAQQNPVQASVNERNGKGIFRCFVVEQIFGVVLLNLLPSEYDQGRWWGALGVYALMRYLLYDKSIEACHEEELYCDEFALRTGEDAADTKLLFDGAGDYFIGFAGVQYILGALAALISDGTHPSHWYRIWKMRKAVRQIDARMTL